MPPFVSRLAVVALVGSLTSCSLLPGDDDPDVERDRTGAGPVGDSRAITDEDLDAVEDLLEVRAAALVSGQRRRFMATLDPGNPALRRKQRVLFDNLQKLPIDKLYYGLDVSRSRTRVGTDVDARFSPRVYEHLELGTVFTRPVSNRVSMRFVQRDGRWLVAGERFDEDDAPQERPWFGGPIEAALGDDVLVVTDEGADVGAEELLDSTLDALAETAAVLDEPDDQALLVDATTNGRPVRLSRASGQDAGAVTFTVLATDREGDDVEGPAGTVVKANPEYVTQLVDDDRTLRHELVHVLLAEYGETNPLWVTEGIAEYVAYQPLLLARSVATDDRLVEAIDDRRVALTSADDWGKDPELDYLSAQAFAEYLISRSGLVTYREMMDLFDERGRRRDVSRGRGLVPGVLREVYGLTPAEVAEGGFELLRGLDR
ncbi:hypothetical protein ABFT23_18835 [Nocardioides sp. C4-1]|uniref:hypothetical protein n=1 Tax=Nocardioides sp. C4-1 TaxID=3151851 RepID=UPI003267BF65